MSSSYSVVGYTYDGEFYCSINCLPNDLDDDSDGVNVVFAGDEWDHYPTCGGCNGVCDEVLLTTEGEGKLKRDQEM